MNTCELKEEGNKTNIIEMTKKQKEIKIESNRHTML